MSEEDFRAWVSGRGRHLPLAVGGHTFLLEKENVIRVDEGRFVYEEALELIRMLNSRNPLDHVYATAIIWGRNGILRLIVLALIGIIVVLLIALARR